MFYPFVVIQRLVHFDLFFLLHFANNLGAIFFAALPLIHLDVQKNVKCRFSIANFHHSGRVE
jgi:hypothetical protein